MWKTLKVSGSKRTRPINRTSNVTVWEGIISLSSSTSSFPSPFSQVEFSFLIVYSLLLWKLFSCAVYFFWP